MHIKKFKAKTLEDVLKSIKVAFGNDAVILSTKKGTGIVEVLAAVDFDIEEIEKAFSEDGAVKNELHVIREGLSDIKQLFSSIVKDAAINDISAFGSGALKLYQEMISIGIHEGVSKRVIKMASAYENGKSSLRDRCCKAIKEHTTTCNPLSGCEKPKLLALVGSTGVGKTMTIAKLAGKLKQSFKAKVGIVSIDNIRPGANEMLKTYAKTLDVPVDMPTTKESLNKTLWGHKDKDIVLIDTPGKNPKDGNAIMALKNMLNGGFPIRTGLVLSVTSRDDVMYNACKGFGALPVDCLIFTKIDEVRSFGSMLNTFEMTRKPIAYLCNGQRIPDDIGLASNDALGNLVMGKG